MDVSREMCDPDRETPRRLRMLALEVAGVLQEVMGWTAHRAITYRDSLTVAEMAAVAWWGKSGTRSEAHARIWDLLERKLHVPAGVLPPRPSALTMRREVSPPSTPTRRARQMIAHAAADPDPTPGKPTRVITPRLTSSMHRRLTEAAARAGCSMNRFVIDAIEQAISGADRQAKRQQELPLDLSPSRPW